MINFDKIPLCLIKNDKNHGAHACNRVLNLRAEGADSGRADSTKARLALARLWVGRKQASAAADLLADGLMPCAGSVSVADGHRKTRPQLKPNAGQIFGDSRIFNDPIILL